MADGITISENLSLIRQFLQFLTNGDNEVLRSDLERDLKSFVDNYDYRSALFIDRNCKVRLVYPGQDTIIGDYLLPRLPDKMNQAEIEITDIHQAGKVSFVHIDLLIPLRRQGPADTSVFGIVVLRIDPEEVLFPLVRQWPSVSKTSEAYLIRRDGDQVAYLNEPRYADKSGIIVRRSVREERNADLLAFRESGKRPVQSITVVCL